ncbi:hypothetical protein PCO31110_05057 [Pandoraea communis]|uniref:Uncharacterized protein n=1 Tax=Pandoraea communis TaxID=2508297 RepID=A0A5E4Z4X4_9BURK|nr:hypothetical protein PCO31110_05057 [Pandoraea communis]
MRTKKNGAGNRHRIQALPAGSLPFALPQMPRRRDSKTYWAASLTFFSGRTFTRTEAGLAGNQRS